MVHRQTGAASAFRAYDGGGARALIDKIDDGTLMQSMSGQGMKGESFSPSKGGGKSKGPEAPQNYGFTSVVAKASKGAGGMIKQCAEGFMSFMGGNRSFPVGAMMDDRRHRLKNLIKDAAEGSTAMHGMKEWGQQFLMTDNGVFLTGNAGQTQGGSSGGGSSGGAGVAATAAAGGSGSGSGQGENFKIRLALVDNQNGKTQQQSSSSGAKQLARTFQTGSGVEFEIETYVLNEDESRLYNAEIAKGKSVAEAERIVEARAGQIQALAGGDGGSSGGSSSGGTGAAGSSKPTGQKTLHKEKSDTFVDMTANAINTKRGDGYMNVTGDISQTYHKDPKHDTRCDDSHVHIGWDDDSKVWVNKDGCWSSKPIQLRKCMDKSASSSSSSGARATVDDPHPPAFSGPPPYYMDSPFATGQDAKLQFALTDPLAVMLTIDVPVDNYSGFGDPIIHPLGLKFKSPLYLDPADGFLTSTGGGAGGVPEAPADGLMYGRQSLGGTPAWQRALAITGDVLDGGNF